MSSRKKTRFFRRIFLLSIVLLVAYGTFTYFRPLPVLQAQTSLQTPASEDAPTLPWPKYGQAAVGAVGFGVLETHGEQESMPIASVAKVMTALAVLEKKPLTLGEQGPLITITQADIDVYNDYLAKDGSLAKIKLGEKITQYQALQALLLPSANNFADTLAVWAFGSLENYIIYAKGLSQEWGLSKTHIADASGFSPQTMSSAYDLVLLGEKALAHPVVAQIVKQKQAKIPVAGTIYNVNGILGLDNVVGIKTGNTDEAGGCFLVAAERIVESKKITVIGAVMGAPNVDRAIIDSRPIVRASDNGFKTITAIRAGQTMGSYQVPWGDKIEVRAKKDLQLFKWQGQKIKIDTKLDNINNPENENDKVGTITVRVNGQNITTDAVLKNDIPEPSWRWRIFER